MEIKKEYTYTKTYVAKTYCDRCKDEIINHNNMHDYTMCKITRHIGEVFPEADCQEKYEVDLCDDCAIELFIYLDSNGYRINEVSDD